MNSRRAPATQGPGVAGTHPSTGFFDGEIVAGFPQ